MSAVLAPPKPIWTTALPDWGERILAGRSLTPVGALFPEEADAAMEVFHSLRMVDAIVDGVQGPLMGDVCLPWINDFAEAIFGSYDEATNNRLIQEYFLLISKKNGKSTDAAAIMLTALIRNRRQSGEFLILAPTVEIANNSFGPARDMIKADDELKDMLRIQENIRTITHLGTGATLKVVAADSDTVGGKKAIGVLVDELWLFGKQPNAENMLREATGGLVSRPEGFTIFLSTQSDQAPAGVFKQKLNYARDVRDGKIDDPKFLPCLYEFPPEILEVNGHRDPSLFYVTNPNLGLSVSQDWLDREFAKAENAGEDSMCGFLAKHLNVEIGVNIRSNNWAGAPYWKQCEVVEVTLDYLIKNSEVVVAGADGGGLDDLLGFCLIGRERKTRRWLIWCYAWAHSIVLERRKNEAARLLDLQEAKCLKIVDTPGQDVQELAEIVARVFKAGKLHQIGVDPSGIGGIIDAIVEAGVPEKDNVMGVQQGWKLTGAIKTVERKLVAKEISHAPQPLMDWCVGNAKSEVKGSNLYITKQVSGSGKIDPLLALFNAASIMLLNPPSKEKQYQMRVF